MSKRKIPFKTRLLKLALFISIVLIVFNFSSIVQGILIKVGLVDLNWKDINKIEVSMDQVLSTRANVFSFNHTIIVNEANEIALFDYEGNLIERKEINADSSSVIGMDHYFAVIDHLQGNIFILDYTGVYVGEINYLGPIVKTIAASDDMFVVITQNNDFIVFDYEGHEKSRIKLPEGELLGLDISKDKETVLITLLSTSEKNYVSKLLIYSMKSNAMQGADNYFNSVVFGTRIYNDIIMIVDMQGLHAYRMGETDSDLWSYERVGSLINYEIDQNGNVFEITEHDEMGILKTYKLRCVNKDGQEIYTYEMDNFFNHMSLHKGQIMLSNENELIILNLKGEIVKIFEATDQIYDTDWLSDNRIIIEYNDYVEIKELAY